MTDRTALLRLGAFLVVSAPSWILLVAAVGARIGPSSPEVDATAVTLFALLQLGILGVLRARGSLSIGDHWVVDQ